MAQELAEVLRGFDGVARFQTLVQAGVTRAELRTALARGEVVRLAPRLYAGAEFDVSRDRNRRVAALAQAGPDAVLSHATAAACWGLRRAQVGEDIHVTVGRGRLRRQLRGVVVHQSERVESCRCAGWPVTSPRATMVGLAADPDEDALRFPALAAVQQGLISIADLADPAAVPRRALGRWNRVAQEARAGAESGGEGLFWRLVRDSDLPVPTLNQWVTAEGVPYRVDALWPQFRLGAEIDGREFHTRVGDFERDHVRQNRLHAEGLVLIRFTVAQVRGEPGAVLRQTSANLSSRAADLGLAWPAGPRGRR